MKKILSLVLVVAMLLGMCTFASAEETGMPEMNTTDPIKLVWVNHGNDRYSMDYFLAKQFMEKYPNITVELINITDGDYNAALMNMITNGEMPDVGCAFYDVGPNVSNKILADLTVYAKNDPDYQALPEGTREAWKFGTDRYWGVTGMTQPFLVFLDKAQFERWNVELPAHEDFTFEMLLEYMTSFTDVSQGLFSWSGGIGFWGHYSNAMGGTARGEGGWDGAFSADFTAWCEGMNVYNEMHDEKHKVYNGDAHWLEAVPDNAWTGSSGRIAVYLDNYWLIFNMYNQGTLDNGIEWVPYIMPMAEDGTGCVGANDNMFFISAECEHPREAWELLKWMTWGKDGWMERVNIIPRVCWSEEGAEEPLYLAEETYKEAKARCEVTGETMPNYAFAWSSGATNLLPVVNDPELNAAVAAIMPDLGYWNDWEAFFNAKGNIAPAVGRTCPSWNDFWANVYANGDYNGEKNLDRAATGTRTVDPMDYVEYLNAGFADQAKKSYEKFCQVYGIEP